MAASTFSMATTDFTASITRKYATADTPTLTLSRVMMPWDWIGIVMIRSDTRCRTSTKGMIIRNQGWRKPSTLPSRNRTPCSYCLTIFTASPSNSRTTTRTMIRGVMGRSVQIADGIVHLGQATVRLCRLIALGRAAGWSAGAATTQGMGSNRPSRSTSGALAALRVLHGRVRPRKHERLMSVVVADEVRRRPVPSPNLDDLGRLVGRTDNPAVHVQPVTHYCAHGNSSQGSLPAQPLPSHPSAEEGALTRPKPSRSSPPWTGAGVGGTMQVCPMSQARLAC